MTNWKEIHPDFTPELQKEWENFNFDRQQTRHWVEDGLKAKDYEFAFYLKKKNFNSSELSTSQLSKLREKYSSWRANLTAQEWLDYFYSQEIRVQVNNLDIKSKNLKGCLDLRGFENLKVLDCCDNQLTNLELDNLTKLERICCNNNLLEKLNLSSLNAEKLGYLDISNNNFLDQDLSFLSHLTNLRDLRIGKSEKFRIDQQGRFVQENDNNSTVYNRFHGSLQHLKKMTDLETLGIANTDIDSGLEYLPESLKNLSFFNGQRPEAKVGKLYEELLIYGWNLRAWKENHQELMTKVKGSDWVNVTTNDGFLKTMQAMPGYLHNKEKTKENYNLSEMNYRGFAIRNKHPFSWEINQDRTLSSEELPIKLYNIKTGEVEWTQNNPNIKNYTALSYVWGDMKENEKKKQVYKKNNGEIEEKEVVITKWGVKTLEKAIRTCEYLGIDYLWMDQLCINQSSTDEKNQEVPKMRQYYNNSAVTLISINTESSDENAVKKNSFIRETLKKIVNSQWFTRSWTYQEGYLSKQTIFVFDDALIDGRAMATLWASLQKPVGIAKNDGWMTETDLNYLSLSENLNRFITPIGWTYGKSNDKEPFMNLHEALEVIKNRGRSMSVDGIYSILGLLPYGHKVEPKYKKWGEEYTTEDLEGALLDVMKVAIKNDYLEPLVWFGPRRSKPCLWWIPEVDGRGSVNLREIMITNGNPNYKPMANIKFTENGIELIGSPVHNKKYWL